MRKGNSIDGFWIYHPSSIHENPSCKDLKIKAPNNTVKGTQAAQNIIKCCGLISLYIAFLPLGHHYTLSVLDCASTVKVVI